MKEIKLSNGKTVKMREPKVRDMKIVSSIKDDLEKETTLISNLTGLTPQEVDELNMKDFNLLDEALKDFLS